MTAPGARWRQPAPVCVALAAAAHAAVLLTLALPAQDAPQGLTAAHTVMQTRTVAEAMPATAGATEPPAPEAAPTQGVAADAGEPSPLDAGQPGQADTPTPDATMAPSTAPAFEANAAPMLEHPDAPSPPEGVRLRVFVQLGPQGVATDIVASTPPGETEPPPAFQKAATRALRQAQFKAGSGPRYCFLARFEPGAAAPQLAWLPGAERDAARCLTGRQPPAREIEAATAP